MLANLEKQNETVPDFVFNDQQSSAPKNGQGGSIRVLPATDFSSPSQQHEGRLSQINSQQNVEFAPPMPRPYVIAHTW